MTKLKKKSLTQTHHHSNHDHARLIGLLKKAGLKLTETREQVLCLLETEHGPFSADEILNALPKHTCDPATVYRTMLQFEEHHITRRCDFGDGIARYELRDESGHHHHHVLCTQCKKIEAIEESPLLAKLEKALSQIPLGLGFTQVSHTLEFFGLCAACGKSKKQ